MWWYLCVRNTDLDSDRTKIDFGTPFPQKSSKVCPNSVGALAQLFAHVVPRAWPIYLLHICLRFVCKCVTHIFWDKSQFVNIICVYGPSIVHPIIQECAVKTTVPSTYLSTNGAPTELLNSEITSGAVWVGARLNNNSYIADLAVSRFDIEPVTGSTSKAIRRLCWLCLTGSQV